LELIGFVNFRSAENLALGTSFADVFTATSSLFANFSGIYGRLAISQDSLSLDAMVTASNTHICSSGCINGDCIMQDTCVCTLEEISLNFP
jgi:hypothetical protein